MLMRWFERITIKCNIFRHLVSCISRIISNHISVSHRISIYQAIHMALLMLERLVSRLSTNRANILRSFHWSTNQVSMKISKSSIFGSKTRVVPRLFYQRGSSIGWKWWLAPFEDILWNKKWRGARGGEAFGTLSQKSMLSDLNEIWYQD